jgi:hypothetical protein
MANDPRDDYRDTMQEYEKARSEAINVIKLVKSVADGFGYNFPTFLTATFNLVSPGSDRSKVNQLRFDLTSWPDREELTKVLTAWHQAFERVHAAWNRMAEADRTVAKPPPAEMKAN